MNRVREVIQNREVNIVENIILIQKVNTKWSVRQHGSSTNTKVGAGAAEE
jgi:hypothetical protein